MGRSARYLRALGTRKLNIVIVGSGVHYGSARVLRKLLEQRTLVGAGRLPQMQR